MGASDTTSVSVAVESGSYNLEICNGGLSALTMNFDLENVPSFTLINSYNRDAEGRYLGSTCECKRLSVPSGTEIGFHVEGVYVDGPYTYEVIPLDGVISVPMWPGFTQYFTNGNVNDPPGVPQRFKIVQGIYSRIGCDVRVYK